ncbi:hypothetical protein EVAR_42385_1 [Eumeta japonica]|uniref:Uncharacterized protein n=1 Tax=Eumeta variegata TaxID=151549 RepID=A0A4C1YJY4_EUMVA|nr:hypothetical protein EVAR_42385_1 [Eumeta japonica]
MAWRSQVIHEVRLLMPLFEVSYFTVGLGDFTKLQDEPKRGPFRGPFKKFPSTSDPELPDLYPRVYTPEDLNPASLYPPFYGAPTKLHVMKSTFAMWTRPLMPF